MNESLFACRLLPPFGGEQVHARKLAFTEVRFKAMRVLRKGFRAAMTISSSQVKRVPQIPIPVSINQKGLLAIHWPSIHIYLSKTGSSSLSKESPSVMNPRLFPSSVITGQSAKEHRSVPSGSLFSPSNTSDNVILHSVSISET